MLKWFCLIILIIKSLHGYCQPKTMAEIKTELEKSPNSPLYVKDILKKKFRLDTVMVTRTSHFTSLADSIAYKGILKKVYGPFTIKGQKFLVQILARLPNTFYRISQIFIDTSVFRYRIADSIGNSILSKLKNHQDSFEHLAQTYSMGGEASTKGDLGWISRGSIIPEMETAIAKRKKGEVFKVWTKAGVHIIKKTSDPKQDTGFVLMLRVIL